MVIVEIPMLCTRQVAVTQPKNCDDGPKWCGGRRPHHLQFGCLSVEEIESGFVNRLRPRFFSLLWQTFHFKSHFNYHLNEMNIAAINQTRETKKNK
jgi:hypothetical protein